MTSLFSLCLALLSLSFLTTAVAASEFTFHEATIESIHLAFAQNRLTSRQLVDFYLDRIQTLNPSLRCVLEVNPDALAQADEADRLRAAAAGGNGTLGDLHGIPVLLKDSIGTDDKMNTTAGSYALLGARVPRDAFVVERLRSAGAVILGKASMSEWYSLRSPQMPRGWCARGGQGVISYSVINVVDGGYNLQRKIVETILPSKIHKLWYTLWKCPHCTILHAFPVIFDYVGLKKILLSINLGSLRKPCFLIGPLKGHTVL